MLETNSERIGVDIKPSLMVHAKIPHGGFFDSFFDNLAVAVTCCHAGVFRNPER